MSFGITRLLAVDRNFTPMLDAISADEGAVLKPAGAWGAFAGLFGLASNELFLMSVGDVTGLDGRLLALDPVAAAETLPLEATVRPSSDSPAPLERKGLYVFRFFEVANRDVEEIAAMSRQAWESFEDTSDYAAEPRGLFCQSDRTQERGRMLLLTWYDGFESWTTSRKPDERARDIFVRRHQMTRGTIAYATRLVAAQSASGRGSSSNQ